eukprot:3778276-Amphidinium_carterae.1
MGTSQATHGDQRIFACFPDSSARHVLANAAWESGLFISQPTRRSMWKAGPKECFQDVRVAAQNLQLLQENPPCLTDVVAGQ